MSWVLMPRVLNQDTSSEYDDPEESRKVLERTLSLPFPGLRRE